MPSFEGLTVLAVYEAGWTACRSADGDTFFFNLQTDEVSTTPPAGAMMAAKGEESAKPPALADAVAALVQAEAADTPVAEPAPPANILQELGDWMICEDAQGEFYWNVSSSTSYDKPPEELLLLYQNSDQSRDREMRQQQLREIWIAKQQQLRAERDTQQMANLSSISCSTQRTQGACRASPQLQSPLARALKTGWQRYQH